MIVRRLFMALAAAAAFAACAAVCVVALAFALYACAEPYFGRAGAAATVAGAAALSMGLGAVALALGARPRKRATTAADPANLIDRVIKLIREKPFVTVVAAIGAGLMLVRDPKYLGAALRSFVEGRPPKRR